MTCSALMVILRAQ